MKIFRSQAFSLTASKMRPSLFSPSFLLGENCFTSASPHCLSGSGTPNETRPWLTTHFRNGSQAGCQGSMSVAKVDRAAALKSQITTWAIMVLQNYSPYFSLTFSWKITETLLHFLEFQAHLRFFDIWEWQELIFRYKLNVIVKWNV